MKNRHTVILGTGATIATIPNGDKNGKKSSVMSGLIEKLHLQDILGGVDLRTQSDNLEDIYSELHSRPECRYVTLELEKRLYDYFASLELPDEPTVYDFLILSLTEKDAIATFSWDPLLIQAYVRCRYYTDNLPHIFCLHGNVSMGFCSKDKEFGTTDAICPICGKTLPPTKLLFPVRNKSYKSDEYISGCWDAIEQCIMESGTITIFGYSAPTTDVEAVSLLKKAWGDLKERQLEDVSVIDVIDKETMLDRWRDFIYSHHYKYTNDFFSSYLGMFPRRSWETVFAMYNLNVPTDGSKGFKVDMSWNDIEELLWPLFEAEKETPQGKNYPLYYTAKGFFDR